MVADVVRGDRAAGATGRDGHGALQLDGISLRVLTPNAEVIESVMGMLVPACSVAEPTAVVQWALRVEEHRAEVRDEGDLFEGRLLLELPYGGRRLAVVGMDGGVMRLVAVYRRGALPVVMEVDARQRVTRLLVSPGDEVGLRWADYLARVFFASRLLGSGWRMLHASAVAVDGRALVFLAGRHGGKSTLAHRAVRNLGAHFLADDLVLIGPDGTVVGWPTRVAVPAQLAGDAEGRCERRVVAGLVRERVLFTPAQHRAALGVEYSPPVPLGAVVIVDGSGAVEAGVRAQTADAQTLDRAVAGAADVPQQLLYVSDPLGLMGGPRLADQAAGTAPPAALLAGAPAAVLRVAVEQLPQAPVWQALEGVVSGLGRRR
ncbi:hypothetical protein MHW47_05970 [Streptomyces sp. OfavH-34-F]|uniref:hypothetical protein n=1 Tax=Streptomyces sp. OfavH-34-F TaxID=2917760 RepID=UPI001EF1E9B2|nr:hypothetical protein [Streptomyces sp. OfavH-34-F]MCG7523988.1 hypothetical protein [Streptomyces sp. OfavH-34-F]